MRNHKKRRPKIGLALSTGGARALSQIGIIKVLKDAGIDIDLIAGVSMGSMLGAGYAMTRDIKVIEDIALKTDWKQLFSLVHLCLPTHGIMDGSKIEKFIESHIGEAKFSDTIIPLAVIAADIATGEGVVFKEGSIAKAVRASISIPVIFEPYSYDGRFLVDGGLVEPVPVKLARTMGADFVIAVNPYPVLREHFPDDLHNIYNIKKEDRGDPIPGTIQVRADEVSERGKKVPGVAEVAVNTLSVMGKHLALPQLLDADLVISPDVEHVGPFDYVHAKEVIELGEKAAVSALAKYRVRQSVGHKKDSLI